MTGFPRGGYRYTDQPNITFICHLLGFINGIVEKHFLTFSDGVKPYLV